MKIPKCSKTISGKHEFVKKYGNDYGRNYGDSWYKYPECRYCGLIDDRKLKVKLLKRI